MTAQIVGIVVIVAGVVVALVMGQRDINSQNQDEPRYKFVNGKWWRQ